MKARLDLVEAKKEATEAIEKYKSSDDFIAEKAWTVAV